MVDTRGNLTSIGHPEHNASFTILLKRQLNHCDKNRLNRTLIPTNEPSE